MIIDAVAVNHGSLTVTVKKRLPNALADDETVVAPKSEVTIDQENNRMFVFSPGVSWMKLSRR